LDLRDKLAETEEALRRAQAALEKAEADSQAKDAFINLVSHELRAPLGSILIWSQLLRGEVPDAATLGRALGMIERSTRTLARLIDDLLDGSRIVAGTLQVDKAPVELRPVLEAAVAAERPAAEARKIELDLDVAAEPLRVMGEARRLQQVVGNLVSNAVKFTPEGGRVQVRLSRAGDAACIEVADSGAGIGPDLLPHLFERVRPAAAKRTQKGLGLGLPIARHLVERHGGRIEAVSPGPDQGSTFSVSLPLLRESAGVAALSQGAPRQAARLLEGRSLLLVDDQQDALEAVAVLLRHAGARVDAVNSAAQAMAAVERQQFDAMVSDIAMPVEDGYVLIRRVRQHPHGVEVPALALTAYATIEDRGKALAAGYDQHMAKPVDPDRLIETVEGLSRARHKH
jgi:CheY-like chemotaxis protein